MVACTFNEETCESLIGTELDGRIKKVSVEPYEYVIPDTGEMVKLSYRYEYTTELDEMLEEELARLEIAA